MLAKNLLLKRIEDYRYDLFIQGFLPSVCVLPDFITPLGELLILIFHCSAQPNSSRRDLLMTSKGLISLFWRKVH
jgi:hypothetical protein